MARNPSISDYIRKTTLRLSGVLLFFASTFAARTQPDFKWIVNPTYTTITRLSDDIYAVSPDYPTDMKVLRSTSLGILNSRYHWTIVDYKGNNLITKIFIGCE